MARFRVDLRSDTVTTPSAAMRRAMAEAEVGDAWYGDDPTVNELQERAAALVGAEAALFVPTGTMANQIGLRLHVTGAGHLVVCDERAHVATTEVMTSAVLSGIAYRTGSDPSDPGMTAELARTLLEPDTYFDVEMVDLLAVENTLGGYGGAVMPVEQLRAVRAVADEAGVPIHLDGARIFNAAAAAGIEASAWARLAETSMFCLSKGLGAPVGSVLCGPAEMIREARRIQILLGGAWRQAGVLAAAGLVALDEGRARLGEDHARARRLAEVIAETTPGAIDPATVATNMVFVDTEVVGMPLLETIERLAALGVGAVPVPGYLRMVTHVDVDDDGLDHAIDAWRSVAASFAKGE